MTAPPGLPPTAPSHDRVGVRFLSPELRRVGADPQVSVARTAEVAERKEDSSQLPPQVRCRRCRERKPTVEFSPNPKVSTGLSSWCKDCHREAARVSREKYRERYNAARRKPKQQRTCELCGAEFETSIGHQRFCREAHQRAAERQRNRQAPGYEPPPTPSRTAWVGLSNHAHCPNVVFRGPE